MDPYYHTHHMVDIGHETNVCASQQGDHRMHEKDKLSEGLVGYLDLGTECRGNGSDSKSIGYV